MKAFKYLGVGLLSIGLVCSAREVKDSTLHITNDTNHTVVVAIQGLLNNAVIVPEKTFARMPLLDLSGGSHDIYFVVVPLENLAKTTIFNLSADTLGYVEQSWNPGKGWFKLFLEEDRKGDIVLAEKSHGDEIIKFGEQKKIK